MNKQQALKRAIDAATWAETRLEKEEYEAGFHWIALADTWANIAGQIPEEITARPVPVRKQEVRDGMSQL